MNRTQFWILIAGSSLLVLFLFLQIIFTRNAQYAQAKALAAQQFVTEGRAADTRLRQLAMRIYQVANQNQDQGLKDLLARQQIIVNPSGNTNSAPQQPEGSANR